MQIRLRLLMTVAALAAAFSTASYAEIRPDDAMFTGNIDSEGFREMRFGTVFYLFDDGLGHRDPALGSGAILFDVEIGDVIGQDANDVFSELLPRSGPHIALGQEKYFGYWTRVIYDEDAPVFADALGWMLVRRDADGLEILSSAADYGPFDGRSYGPAGGITVGQVPEPGSMILALVATIGSLVLRPRRRRACLG